MYIMRLMITVWIMIMVYNRLEIKNGIAKERRCNFAMSVRDMHNQAFDKVNGGDAFGYSFMVFMALIVEGHRSPPSPPSFCGWPQA